MLEKLLCNFSQLRLNAQSAFNPAPWDIDTCNGAAFSGHLEVLKWARENGCEWNSSTCSHAIREGHLEILKWAHANGCARKIAMQFFAAAIKCTKCI